MSEGVGARARGKSQDQGNEHKRDRGGAAGLLRTERGRYRFRLDLGEWVRLLIPILFRRHRDCDRVRLRRGF